MTTITQSMDQALGDILLLTVDAMAVGSGTGAESSTATSLANREHKSITGNQNVALIDNPNTGVVELTITIKGGLEVPAGTTITEVAAIVDGETIAVDEFPGVTIEAGDAERFSVPIEATLI
jgi:hypothetical protein